MSQSTSIEEAIRNGDHDYWDEIELAQGRSGGKRCPKCRKWTAPTRKRKHHHPTWIRECESCEIKDPFKRMWHKFNRECDDDEIAMYNEWLREVRLLSSEISALSEASKMKLHKMICEIPFFEF